MKGAISIFVPAYEVEDHLEATIGRIPEPLWERVRTCWILDDGSRDATGRIASRLAETNARIRVVIFEENRGYGGVVKEGMTRCRDDGSDFAVCLHGDGQYPPEKVGEFVDFMTRQQIDLLQGSRHAGGNAAAGGMPLYKILAGRSLTRLENRALGLRLTDFHSGFLCYSRRALEFLPFHALSGSFDIDVELIACARALGLRIAELPILTRYAGEVSHLRPIPYGLRVLRMVCRHRTGYYRRLMRAEGKSTDELS